ncbi:MAG: hypothetical protein GY754_03830 [bacterium]|nr:hypothetical protein [bacterium]
MDEKLVVIKAIREAFEKNDPDSFTLHTSGAIFNNTLSNCSFWDNCFHTFVHLITPPIPSPYTESLSPE